MRPRRDTAGRWFYLILDAEMEEVGLEEMEAYVLHRQNTVSQYIVTRLRRPGAQVTWRWWDQAGINFGQEDGRAAEAEGEGGRRELDMAAVERCG